MSLKRFLGFLVPRVPSFVLTVLGLLEFIAFFSQILSILWISIRFLAFPLNFCDVWDYWNFLMNFVILGNFQGENHLQVANRIRFFGISFGFRWIPGTFGNF